MRTLKTGPPSSVNRYHADAITAGDETRMPNCGASLRGNRGSATSSRKVMIGPSVSQHRTANENDAHAISV
jgi:hypothetical protein